MDDDDGQLGATQQFGDDGDDEDFFGDYSTAQDDTEGNEEINDEREGVRRAAALVKADVDGNQLQDETDVQHEKDYEDDEAAYGQTQHDISEYTKQEAEHQGSDLDEEDQGSEVDEDAIASLDTYDEIDDSDTWQVITAFFRAHGLVHQQLESFNDFVTYRMQEIVATHPPIVLSVPIYQNEEGEEGDTQLVYRLKFGQLVLSRPTMEEREGESRPIWPQEARLRNLTYSAPLFVHIEQETFRVCGSQEVRVDKTVYENIPLGRVSNRRFVVPCHLAFADTYDVTKCVLLAQSNG